MAGKVQEQQVLQISNGIALRKNNSAAMKTGEVVFSGQPLPVFNQLQTL